MKSIHAASLALLFIACENDNPSAPPAPDGGGINVDGGTPHPNDAAPVEDASVEASIVLTASSMNVTTEGTVTLTAVVTGGTPTSVSFSEGTTAIGDVAASPFTKAVSYTFAENGQHTYVAKATMPGGKVLTSAPVVVTVNVAPNGSFVDPVAGADTNDGNQATPFKTIRKAAQTVTAGQTIYLAAGTYALATQPTLDFNFTKLVNVRPLVKTGVIISGNGSNLGFTFGAGGDIRDIAFDHMYGGVSANAGTFTASGLTFSNVGQPISVTGTAVATIDETNLTNVVANPVGTGLSMFVAVDGGADVTLKCAGTTIEGLTLVQNGIFARGHSTLRVDGLTIKDLKSHSFVVNDNAHVTLTSVIIKNSGLGTSSGADKASILVGGYNTEEPHTPSITLTGSEISDTPGPAITVSVYTNTSVPTMPSVSLTDSHIDRNQFYGVVIDPTAQPVAGSAVTLTAKDTTFDGNTPGAISASATTVSLEGGSVSNNVGGGVALTRTLINSLKVRGTTFASNTGDFISFAGTNTSTLDLGKAGDLGNVVFSGVPNAKSAVNLSAVIQGFAVGNTWMPNVQGADASGKYTTTTTLSPSTGANATIAAGASLVVQP